MTRDHSLFAEALLERPDLTEADLAYLPKNVITRALGITPIVEIDVRSEAAEVGDLLFAVVNVARHLGVEPEAALRAATLKFRRRFEQVEALATERGIDLHDAELASLDALWDEIKTRE